MVAQINGIITDETKIMLHMSKKRRMEASLGQRTQSGAILVQMLKKSNAHYVFL